jgi:hypothetical protein
MGLLKKTNLTEIIKSMIVGCGVVIFFSTSTQADSNVGGRVYCGKGIEKIGQVTGEVDFLLEVGPPETWPKLLRIDIYQSINHKDHISTLNIDTDEVPLELKNEMKRKGLYIFPCDILKSKASWKAYWLNDPAAKQRIKLLKQTHEKYMDCLYDHRNEINKLNENVIEHRCKKKARWEPPGLESVAEGEL